MKIPTKEILRVENLETALNLQQMLSFGCTYIGALNSK
jgi:hypothetical protein